MKVEPAKITPLDGCNKYGITIEQQFSPTDPDCQNCSFFESCEEIMEGGKENGNTDSD